MQFSALWMLAKNWLVLIYLSNNIDDRDTLYLVISVLLLGGLFQGVIGIGQYINGGPLGLEFLGEKSGDTALKSAQAGIGRVSGTIGHPNKMALFLGSMLQLNLSCLFARLPDKFKRYRWLFFVPLTIMLFTLLVSYSRSGWASFIAGGIVNSSWCMARRTGKKITSIITVIALFISLALMAFLLIPSVRNRILMDDKGAAEVRKPLAQVARNVISDNPWLGIGLNNYASCYPEYDDTAYWVGLEFPHVVHNEWLLIAAESGIPAFFCFIFIVSWVLLNLVRISRSNLDPLLPYVAIGFFSGVVSWGMHSLKEFEYIMLTVRFWFNIGVMLTIILFLDNLGFKKNDTLST